MRSLYWFRSDLRLTDNTAFSEAMKQSTSMIAVFIITPETWKYHHVAPCKIQFLLKTLKELSASLWNQGIPLFIRKTPSFKTCPSLIEKLCRQYDVRSLFFNKEYPLDESQRDQETLKKVQHIVHVHTYHDHCVLPAGAVLSKEKKCFKKFTPFKKEWLKHCTETSSWMTASEKKKKLNKIEAPDPIPVSLRGFADTQISLNWATGETYAKQKLNDFCRKKVSSYHEQRDMIAMKGTSKLSPYLALGILSPRQCITRALKTYECVDLTTIDSYPGLSIWINEFIWRDFYHHLVYFYPDISRNKAFQEKTERLCWSDNPRLLHAWKNGMTGFPIVDAAMRQLNQWGWMHNRLRMVTAMFLTKILFIHWRLGEQYFMNRLIDGDFAANNGGWQWCASTGTDSVPYFRIFNPTTQSQRFDASGQFIRYFCPELSHLDNKTIHNPFAFHIDTKHLDYPKPIVDYKKMRQRTLSLFKKL